MIFDYLKQDKGVAGLTILLSLMTMLFVIGLLVFIFALMGGEIQDSTSLKSSESASDTQNALTLVDGDGTVLTTCNSANQGTISAISSVVNETGGETLGTGNYSYSGCSIIATTTSEYNATSVNVSYSYTSAGVGWDVVNETSSSISGVTDWYDIFIVIGAMVVLILLTVIIITAIRGSGLMAGNNKGSGNVGSA